MCVADESKNSSRVNSLVAVWAKIKSGPQRRRSRTAGGKGAHLPGRAATPAPKHSTNLQLCHEARRPGVQGTTLACSSCCCTNHVAAAAPTRLTAPHSIPPAASGGGAGCCWWVLGLGGVVGRGCSSWRCALGSARACSRASLRQKWVGSRAALGSKVEQDGLSFRAGGPAGRQMRGWGNLAVLPCMLRILTGGRQAAGHPSTPPSTQQQGC